MGIDGLILVDHFGYECGVCTNGLELMNHLTDAPSYSLDSDRLIQHILLFTSMLLTTQYQRLQNHKMWIQSSMYLR